ncbi:uncharacterized protein etaa1b [Parambassis ranga]|uniref:Uncharacterized protein etaa1b n=1 Tax=Parambassis ranga TaxID=210632 RepID=A0A6P7JUN5_9TELE|nr:ewing's tumor-associated antigen 1 [Parambassis ranga]
MSERRTRAAAPGSPEFSELWRTVTKLCQSKTQDKNKAKQMPATATSPACKDLQSPNRRGFSRFPGSISGDSPGDGETSQDIIWDSTSPTQAITGSGRKNTRVVEISDIVNRIAPKDVKPKGTDSPLLQWIGDSAIPCTPEVPKPRARKKSSRQSSVKDLMKLAKQFDENMQQEKETLEELNSVNNNLNEYVVTSKINPTQSVFPTNVKDPQCPPSIDQAEAELHALFDSSTQKISGQLSQSSVTSTCSQGKKDKAVTAAVAEGQQSNLKSAAQSGSAVHPAKEKEPCGNAKNCDAFDDDWENDDLLNDSFVLAMTQNASEQHDTKTITTEFTTVCEPTVNTNSADSPSNSQCKPSCSTIQELCPKPKTTNRSTFKLQPNPHFQPMRVEKKVLKSSFTGLQPKSQMFDQKPVTTKTLSTPQPDNVSNDYRVGCSGADSVKLISDSLWDDGDDDALLYQVCDSIERISNSQPQQVSPSNCQGKQDTAADRQRKTSNPLPIDPAWSASANQQSPCAFVRSNSLPGTSCETVNYQGWNVPMKSANNKSGMSQSFPGSQMSLGTFNQRRDSSGTFQAGNANVDMKPHTVTARAPQSSKTNHTAFKRNVSDSAVISNKVFVTSQMTSKCSAAEIEKKKQEALARRRLRMQNASKP